LQPDQAGICDPKQAVKKKMKKKRTHRPTQTTPARRLQADRWAQKIKTENTLDIKKVIIFVKCNVIFVKRLITAIRFLLINSPLK